VTENRLKGGQRRLFDPSKLDTSLYEKRLFERGIKAIAGVDEVGRGCLAGPVLAAAVILPFPCKIEGIPIQKKLLRKNAKSFLM